METLGIPVDIANFDGIVKEIRRVSDPDKAQIIWDGIKTVRAQKQIPALPRLSRYMYRLELLLQFIRCVRVFFFVRFENLYTSVFTHKMIQSNMILTEAIVCESFKIDKEMQKYIL